MLDGIGAGRLRDAAARSGVCAHGGSHGELARVSGGSPPAPEVTVTGGIVTARTPAAWRAARVPVVGDWVLLDSTWPQRPEITTLLPRRGAVRRVSTHREHDCQVLAAHVDVVLVCVPAFGAAPVLLEALLGVALDAGAEPVMVVTKADLATDNERARLPILLGSVAPGVTVLETNARTGSGVNELAGLLRPDRTAVLLGSSGVGKSTLANALIGAETARTGRTRDRTHGRHTTTARNLMPLPGGGAVIDVPGLRSVTPILNRKAVQQIYEDVQNVASGCRFSDCRHEQEPGCAVGAAVADGTLSAARVQRARQRERDARRQELRHDKRLAAQAHDELVVLAKAAKRRRSGRG